MRLNGTLPVQPFDAQAVRAFGSIHGASGQPPRVVALVVEPTGGVVLLNIVGHKTACSSHGARLMVNGSLLFTPDDTTTWNGPTTFTRLEDATYGELSVSLPGVRMVNYLTLPRSAHLTHGLQTPPTFPSIKPDSSTQSSADDSSDGEGEGEADAPGTTGSQTSLLDVAAALPRYVVGNVHEATPARQTVQSAMRALRIARYCDGRTPAAQALTDLWTDVLWNNGIASGLITPLIALGIRAWRMSGNLQAWAALVQMGLADGSLPRPTQ